MAEKAHLCVVCAWRRDCQKKFFISKEPNPRCADFSKDVTLKNDAGPKTEAKPEVKNERLK